MKHKLNEIISSDANEHDKELACKFFNYGLMYAIGDGPIKVPAVLGGTKDKSYNGLTKSDIDSLVSTISYTISELHIYEKDFAMDAAYIWDKCDADNPETKDMFNLLNAIKVRHSKVKKQIKKLASIQHKLKKYR